MDGKSAQARATSLKEADLGKVRQCKYKPCAGHFFPKRKDQVFCSPSCKTKHTMSAYEAGLKVIEGGKVHAARIENSDRLQRVLSVLSDGKPHTTREIIMAADVRAVNTIVTELRDNGLKIACNPVKGKRGVYEYQMEEGSKHEA